MVFDRTAESPQYDPSVADEAEFAYPIPWGFDHTA